MYKIQHDNDGPSYTRHCQLRHMLGKLFFTYTNVKEALYVAVIKIVLTLLIVKDLSNFPIGSFVCRNEILRVKIVNLF